MQSIVADTTPLNYLVLIQAAEILPNLYRTVLIPPAVKAELAHSNTPAIVRAWISQPPRWLEVVSLKQPDRFGSGTSQRRRAVTFIVRVRLQASRRDADRSGRHTAGGASLSFSGIAWQCEATPGGEGAATGLRRGYVCRELRDSECRWR